MLWLWLLLPAGLIILSVHFEQKRRQQTRLVPVVDEQKAMEEIYRSEGAAAKSSDPKNMKNF
ncbi:hypothetical protein CEH05_06725 [Halobacillus halophilus]|uniref:Uncharacterized protein n=1 Tax=Halobacillus halophilus (strain ATCC 35676 / DSM 2266 / JCM 20832 / KCTC 3685 / LMG 17431 / NBRC 102448 / NCIMB 2269) TaxID=866895 RepID=I0JKL5_HALH3|nr:hypothetical protein [Halobacillus halophilus]ASF38824.1 hypothetical protein CEH05_06725 [Halobacillus halophilus]CCG44684.1 hypothetical protein HBHAL_2338 [Halobacillus halophilus DSM 2266]